jgi:hypothetical protein
MMFHSIMSRPTGSARNCHIRKAEGPGVGGGARQAGRERERERESSHLCGEVRARQGQQAEPQRSVHVHPARIEAQVRTSYEIRGKAPPQ